MSTIKPWVERLGQCDVSPDDEMTHAMQSEIDELRAAQNICGFGAGCLYKEATIDELRAENVRLRDALGMMVQAQSSILGLGDSPVVKFARAALGEKS